MRLRPNFGYLTTLKCLYLSDNLLETLPKEIGKLVDLETLVIRDNMISRLPSEIGNLKQLKHFHAQGNKLKMLPPELSTMTAIVPGGLKLAGNPLVPDLIKSLKVGTRGFMEYIQSSQYKKLYQEKYN
jgi:Leucine-rich repeat (LRR) protein